MYVCYSSGYCQRKTWWWLCVTRAIGRKLCLYFHIAYLKIKCLEFVSIFICVKLIWRSCPLVCSWNKCTKMPMPRSGKTHPSRRKPRERTWRKRSQCVCVCVVPVYSGRGGATSVDVCRGEVPVVCVCVGGGGEGGLSRFWCVVCVCVFAGGTARSYPWSSGRTELPRRKLPSLENFRKKTETGHWSVSFCFIPHSL